MSCWTRVQSAISKDVYIKSHEEDDEDRIGGDLLFFASSSQPADRSSFSKSRSFLVSSQFFDPFFAFNESSTESLYQVSDHDDHDRVPSFLPPALHLIFSASHHHHHLLDIFSLFSSSSPKVKSSFVSHRSFCVPSEEEANSSSSPWIRPATVSKMKRIEEEHLIRRNKDCLLFLKNYWL